MASPLSISIIRTTSLGDVILATAVLDYLAKLPFPVAITWFGRPPTLAVLKESFPELKTVELTKNLSWWSLYRQLSSQDVVIDLQQSIKTRAVCLAVKMSGNATVAFSDKLYRQRHSLLRAAKTRPRETPLPESALHPEQRQYEVAVATCHEAVVQALSHRGEPNLNTQALTAARREARPLLSLPAATVAATRAKIKEIYPDFDPEKPLIAVAPGASYAAKRAPLATFAAILNGAHASAPFGVLLLGDGGDRAVCAELAKELNLAASPIFDVSGKLSFVESVAAVSLCRGILGNDSVLPHCSEALGQPSLTLFGPTIEGFGFAPFRPDSAALSVNIGCRPCSKHGQNPCRFGDRACFTRLPVERIAGQLSAIVSMP